MPALSDSTTASRNSTSWARFNVPTSSYRAYRFPWSGSPLAPPDIAVTNGARGTTTVYASWNGATAVATWRVLGGSSPTQLAVVGSGPKWAFETPIRVAHPARYVAVEALDAAGKVLGRSDTVLVR